jgi:hypothetical protein
VFGAIVNVSQGILTCTGTLTEILEPSVVLTKISVLPIEIPVTIPVLLTVAILGLPDVYVKVLLVALEGVIVEINLMAVRIDKVTVLGLIVNV